MAAHAAKRPDMALVTGSGWQAGLFGDHNLTAAVMDRAVADRPALDGLLEYFPHGFHEPYYKDYLGWDLDGALTQAGFVKECGRLAFLTKVTGWRKPHP